MAQKKLMLLGGLRYLLPVIEEAHKLGAYVITVDYLPDNIAHKYSDEYHNVSILDREAVLELARKLEIDGIMSFAVDPGVTTAAYVAEEMNLPFQGSYESISILQNKGRFRRFLTDNGFNVPKARNYSNLEDAVNDIDFFTWPVIVKPVDSAGSKGVSRIDDPEDLPHAIKYALSESHNGHFIIEDFLEMEGHSSDSEGFTVDGELVFNSFSDQYFDPEALNPYTPSAYIWPSTMPEKAQRELTSELQRMMRLLDLRTGIYNIETRYCKDGKAYIMECSPRGGGNRLAEMIDIRMNANLIKNAVRAALGEALLPFDIDKTAPGIGEVILHCDRGGKFNHIEISDEVKPFIIQKDIWVNPDDEVRAFSGANNAIGTLVLKCQDTDKLSELILTAGKWCKAVTK